MYRIDGQLESRSDVLVRSRKLAFMRSDLDALGDELLKEFPGLRFRGEMTWKQSKNPEIRPDLPLFERLRDCSDKRVQLFFRPESLPPQCVWDKEFSVWTAGYSYPYAYVKFEPAPAYFGTGTHAVPPHVKITELVFLGRKGNASDLDIISRASRRPARVSVKKPMQYVSVQSKDGGPLRETFTDTRNVSVFFGRDAVAWAREKPERVIGLEMNVPFWATWYRPID